MPRKLAALVLIASVCGCVPPRPVAPGASATATPKPRRSATFHHRPVTPKAIGPGLEFSRGIPTPKASP